MKVNIDGYGEIKVKVPKKGKRSKSAIADCVGQAVADTMQLVDPRTQVQRFHPAMGKGGYN